MLLAALGLVICAVLAAVLVASGFQVAALLLGLLALVAIVDLVVIQLRRRRRKRAEPWRHSLFE